MRKRPTLPSVPIRPREGDTIGLLAEVNSMPVTHVARAGTVRETMLFVPRRAGEPVWAWDPTATVTVIFTHAGHLYSWPMHLEEVLPSSYYFASAGEPSAGGRRAFVRVEAAGRVQLTGKSGTLPWTPVTADVSAAGLRLPVNFAAEVHEVLDVSLRLDGVRQDIVARARVVRRTAQELALEFTELASTHEDRLMQVVYRVRERELFERTAKRDGG